MQDSQRKRDFWKNINYKINRRIFRLFLLGVFLWWSFYFASDEDIKFSVHVKAAESSDPIHSGDWYYTLDENDNATVIFYEGNDTELTVDTVDGKKIVALGDNVFIDSEFTKVTLSEGIESIGKNAFCQCPNLQEVHLPDSLISMESGAFCRCYNLTSIELPKNLKKIGSHVFESCNINYIGLSEENPYYVKKDGIIYDRGYSAVVLSSKGELSSQIELPETVETIGGYSFASCDNIISVQFPEGLKEIAEGGFYSCGGLETIQLPQGVETIGKSAFADCDGITEFVLPESVVEVGEGILSYCNNLVEVEIKAPISDLKQICTGCNKLERVTLPEGLKVLNGFSGCYALTELTIPESVEVIESEAFCASGLTSIYIPANVKEIQEDIFWWMEDLYSIEVAEENENYYVQDQMLFSKENVLLGASNRVKGEVEIPEGCVRIGDRGFYDRGRITKVIIPDSVKELGSDVFARCTQLAEISIGDDVIEIGSGCFYGTAYYENEENWENGVCYLDTYALHSDGKEAIIRIKEGCTLLADNFSSSIDNSLKKLLLPESMQYIGRHAFWYCAKLENVIGGSQIKRIGESAFYGNHSLKNIYIQGEEISIEDEAFLDCYFLENVVIDAEKVEIGENCFGGDNQIKKMVFPQLTKSLQNMLKVSYVHEDKQMELVITNMESTELIANGDTYLNGCSGMNIYINAPAEEFEDAQGNWLENNDVYFQDEYYNCRFLMDHYLMEWNVVMAGEEVIPPVTSEEYYAVTQEGPVYSNILWDLDEDGFADSLPETASENINANAIYQVLEQTHSWEVKEILQEISCVQSGIIEYYCPVCHSEKTVSTVELGHLFSEEWTIDVAATCTGTGIKSHHCLREGCEEKGTVIPILSKGHTWDEGVVAIEPGAGTEGKKVYTCGECGETKEESIEALPTPTPTPTELPTESPSPSPVPTQSPSSSPKVTASIKPSVSPAVTATVSPKPTPTMTIVPTEIPELSPVPTAGGTENVDNDQSPAGSSIPAGTGQEALDSRLQVVLSIKKQSKVLLQWNEVPNAKGYQIYRSDKKNKGYQKIKELNETKKKYTDSTVFTDKRYYYRIDAITGEEKISSKIYSIRVPLYQAPAITIAKKNSGTNVKFIQVKLKQYTGKYVEIQYRKGSGRFHKIALSSNHIGKMKKTFRIQYLSGGDMLSIRVRTYSLKKKKRQYSEWSKVKKVII